jgi:UDP-N-acetylglucosamine 2-epimerase (non-hydrolysing)
MKILTIFGTRPEAIKMLPVVNALKKSDKINSRVCVTAQHRKMLDQVLDIFEVTPHHDLNLMKHGQDLTDITSKILIGLRSVLQDERPDWVLVHGDTTTSFSGALAAFYEGIPVGHVEAGLRTNNIKSPFPEEANRQLTSRICSKHFAPTHTARDNLLKEGVCDSKITVTGNTVIDALDWITDKLNSSQHTNQDLFPLSILKAVESSDPILLVTGHRRENFGDGFLNICNALKTLSNNHPGLQIIYPVHLNPNVLIPAKSILSRLTNVHLIPPLDYLPFIALLNRAKIILTDSGGIQEEAPGFGKPVLLMRDTTERPEGLEAGTVKLVGTKQDLIISSVEQLLNDSDEYKKMSLAQNPYGDGKASQRIKSEYELISSISNNQKALL